jgi:hypothetical protein
MFNWTRKAGETPALPRGARTCGFILIVGWQSGVLRLGTAALQCPRPVRDA